MLMKSDAFGVVQAAPPQKLANAEQKTAGNNGGQNVIPPAVTRSRSSRLSRDLDINPETLTNPNSSYTALLLEDIHNFHQNNAPPPPPPAAFSLPPCVSKACSILEAVADLNSSTASNLSTTDQINKVVRKAKQEPILESEITGSDDLMQPSFHKYVTVRRGTTSGGDEDLEEQESSGSNSFVGSQQQWACSSTWEPNSAESTDRWTMSSSRSVGRQNEVSPVGYQRHTVASESGRVVDEGGKKLGAKSSGVGRGRIGSRVSHTAAAAAAAAST